MSLIYNATFDKNTRKLSFEDRAGNEIYSFTVPERGPAVDDITKPLMFKATQDGSSVTLTKDGLPTGSFQTSFNGGKNWSDYPIDTVITLNTGEEVYFRAKADRTSSLNGYFQFVMTGKIEAWHNVMSMLRTNDFATDNTAIRDAFRNLFSGCTSLTKAPALPATTLYGDCYRDMFNGCTSLIKAPELPATTLANYCYAGMFNGCTSLVDTPVLPATTLAQYCYFWMFSNCTSLVESPELTATTLADNCYTSMFYGCSSLNEVRCHMPPAISAEDIPTYTGDGSTLSLVQWLEGVSSTGTFYTNGDADWPSGPSGIPTGWTRDPARYDIAKPLTFRATQDSSTVKLTKYGTPSGDFQTSRDGGNTWSDYTLDSAITLNTGDEVYFRAKADRTSAQSVDDYFQFVMTGKIEAWYNVMSMLRTNDFATYNTVVDYAFNNLFGDCTSLTKAPALPATTLANNCYTSMFNGCTSLTKAPYLPATTLANNCYQNMFSGCASLVKAPALPATTLAKSCYINMFGGCTSIIKAPALPATTLADLCYGNMFNGCTSLSEAPVLPATTLAPKCYTTMFMGCTSLTKAPALPATTLAKNCYWEMFWGCTSLTKAPELTATTLAQNCYQYMFEGCSTLNKVRCKIPSSYSSNDIPLYASSWLKGVASTGTFYTNEDANWPSGTSGIPTGWRRVNTGGPAVDDITKPLTFRATQDGSTVRLTANGSPDGTFQTSMDGGNTWEDYTIGTYIALDTDDEVSFRAKADRTSAQTSKNHFYFEMTGKIEAWHNVMSMYSTNDFATDDTAIRNAFYKLFLDCRSLTKAPVLPATTLVERCYSNMFRNCTSLTKAPALSATTLADFCYLNMFNGCTSLTKSPELTATALATSCYSGMFYGCGSLNEVRCKIPSTIRTEDIPTYTGNGSSTTAYPWLRGVSSTGTFYTNADANWPSGYSGIPTGWTRVNEGAPSVDDITKPLKFRATQNGSTVTLKKNGSPTGEFQTSTDGGNTWTDYTIGASITLHTGDEVYFRAKSDRTSAQSFDDYFQFMMDGKIEAWHNVMSMLRTNDFATYNTVVSYAFRNLFWGCTSLTKAPALPATTLANNCYSGMFSRCTSLTEAPELPATTLAMSCYESMFSGCTSLVNAPVLPATTLITNCYFEMFLGCTSLTKAPELPATTLFGNCYWRMFGGCTSLIKAPALPATTLFNNCYRDMFNGCTSLTEAPALPATTLADHCYYSMFDGCTSLTKAPELPVTTLKSYCYSNMFNGCASLVNAPALPANKLADYCYYNMFRGCTSLVKAPALPATTLADYCYYNMFRGCTSLVKAPDLPAIYRRMGCYIGMFNGCSRLNEVRCQATSELSAENVPKYTGDASNPPAWLEGVASTGTFYTNADANWPSGASGIPTGWTRVPEVAKDDITKPLTFRATQNGSTVSLKKNGLPEGATFQTSRDGGNTWEDYTIDTAIALNTGDEVSFRAKSDREFEQNDSKYFQFNMTGKIEARHNVMSLYRTSDFATYESVMKHAFYKLFKDCTSLTKAPALPATTLTQSCYKYMFNGCTSLTKAPALPATSLAETCYHGMFLGCTSLTEVPILQATRLGTRCYWIMFSGCSSLNEVHCYIPSSYSTEYVSAHADGWLEGVASTGTFYTNADADWPLGSISGIPENWTRINT